MRVPLDSTTMIGRMTAMPSFALILLSIPDVILHIAFGSGRFKPFCKWKRFWSFGVGIAVLVVARSLSQWILFFHLLGSRRSSICEYYDNVLLNGVGGARECVPMFAHNTVVFNQCLAHEGLIDRD